MAVSSAPTTGRITDSVTVPARSAGGWRRPRLPLLVRHPRRHADHPVAGRRPWDRRAPAPETASPHPSRLGTCIITPRPRRAMMHWRVSSHRRPILSMRTTTKISPLEKRPGQAVPTVTCRKKSTCRTNRRPRPGCSTLRCTVRIPPNDPSPLTPHGNGYAFPVYGSTDTRLSGRICSSVAFASTEGISAPGSQNGPLQAGLPRPETDHSAAYVPIVGSPALGHQVVDRHGVAFHSVLLCPGHRLALVWVDVHQSAHWITDLKP